MNRIDMANSTVTFMVYLVTDRVAPGSKIIQVETRITLTLDRLLANLRKPENCPSELLKAISPSSTYYLLNNPFEILAKNVLHTITRDSLKDEAKYTKIEGYRFVKAIAQEFHYDYLHLIIVDVPDTSGTALAIQTLKEKHFEIYKCLTFKVKVALEWTVEDVKDNNAIFLDEYEGTKPPEISALEAKLERKRIYTESFSYTYANTGDDNPDLYVARTFLDQFQLTYSLEVQDGETVDPENSAEFLSFYSLLRCYIPDAQRYSEVDSLSLKATAMKSNFILPPFFWGRQSTDTLVYHEEASWNFPLFVECDTMALLPRKYLPKNDFCVWFQKFDTPFIIGAIVSEDNESGRYRMLLQGIALARLVFALRKLGSQPFIVAICLTQQLVAERYIIMKVGSESEKAFISCKKFDLASKPEDGPIPFQREMFNLASVLESILPDTLDDVMRSKMQAITEAASGMKSLLSASAWTKPEKSKGWSTDSEDTGLQTEDDLGVFDEEPVRAALLQMNYQVAYIAFGYPHLAPVASLTDGQLVGCLKFVKAGGNEVNILQHLASLPSKSNHTVRPFGIWPVTGGSIIGMPAAGNPLTSVANPDAHLLSLTLQLFEAVKFMHENQVAHLDLKPHNILVPLDGAHLTIIDFGLSVFIKNPTQKLSGRVGTKGYTAPEVGRTKFDPIGADLWSVGKVVEELCLLCRPSPSRDLLLALSKQLLHDDPSKRPTMSDVLGLDFVKTSLEYVDK